MNTHQGTLATPVVAPARVAPVFFAALLGLVIVGGVGFAHLDVLHNAAHDYRHSMGFPCH